MEFKHQSEIEALAEILHDEFAVFDSTVMEVHGRSIVVEEFDLREASLDRACAMASSGAGKLVVSRAAGRLSFSFRR